MSEQARPLAPGEMVHGFCGGIFGRDAYACKVVVETRGGQWAVLLDTEDRYYLATGDSLSDLTEYRDNTLRAHSFDCPLYAPDDDKF